MTPHKSAAASDANDREPLLEPGRNCGEIQNADRMAMLVDGERYFTALAEVLERAERFVYFACWDIDSRIVLRRDADGRGTPLRRFLEALTAKKPELNIYFLSWDFAMIYTFQREHLPLLKLGWRTPPQIHFHMDDEHPIGASHHQKFVVADDRAAFVGGIDLTRGRWDTSSHSPEDPRRVTPSGTRYMPFHDVQAVVEGDAAAALGDRFRERWFLATDDRLPAVDPPPGDPWPPSVSPDVEETRVGIAETRPAYRGRPAAFEIRNLYLDAIANAERYLYIENQYLTSSAVVDALAASLSRTSGPDIVIVLPVKSEGWLEEQTMNALRAFHLDRLYRCDEHDRLRVYYPHVAGLNDTWINVHAKLLISDDRLALFGSANISNRSMGLDTECNVAIEAHSPDSRSAVARLRNRLLGEHLGRSADAVREREAARGSLIGAVSDLTGGSRTLQQLSPEASPENDIVFKHQDLLDPEQPTSFDNFLDRFLLKEKPVSKLRGLFPIAGLILLLLSAAFVWHVAPFSESLNPQTIADAVRETAGHPAAPLLAVAGFVIAGLLAFPITVLFVAASLLFDVAIAIPVSMAGCLLSAAITYGIGRALGRNYVRRLAGDRVNSISKWLARKGLVKTALIRMIPSAPFSIVNVIAGASHLGFRDYLLGTGLGMLPGILVITFLGDLTVRILRDPSVGAVAAFAGLSLLFAAILFWVMRRSRPIAAGRRSLRHGDDPS